MFTDSHIIRADFPARASVAKTDNEHEKIGIARIKLHHSQLQLTAVLAGFVEVDRRLTIWNKQADVPAQCEFEVTFTDGKLIRGSYQLWRMGVAVHRCAISSGFACCRHIVLFRETISA
jgi:hypothetical protein